MNAKPQERSNGCNKHTPWNHASPIPREHAVAVPIECKHGKAFCFVANLCLACPCAQRLILLFVLSIDMMGQPTVRPKFDSHVRERKRAVSLAGLILSKYRNNRPGDSMYTSRRSNRSMLPYLLCHCPHSRVYIMFLSLDNSLDCVPGKYSWQMMGWVEVQNQSPPLQTFGVVL